MKNRDNSELHLVEWLRKIQVSWELDLEQLSRVSHVPVAVLDRAFKIPSDELDPLPSIPAGFEPAAALVGLYRQIVGVYPDPQAQNQWLQNPNSVFDGLRPVDVMAMSPEHLAYVAYAVESGLRLTPNKE